MTARAPSIRMLLAVLVVVAAAVGLTAPAGAASDPPIGRSGRVLIVSIPRLTWNDVVDQRPPAINGFLRSAAVGDLSLRTIGPRTSLGEGYVSIGAGNRATASDADAGRMLERVDGYENGTAAQAYSRRTGWAATGKLLQLSIPSIERANRHLLYGARPGSLGEALQDAGRTAVVIANSDVELTSASPVSFDPDAPTGEPGDGDNNTDRQIGAASDPSLTALIEPVNGENRPAGLALMDRRGQVPRGSVSHDLLERDPEAPFGVTLSTPEVMRAFRADWKPGVVALVELSDLERADLYRGRASAAQSRVLARRALAAADRQLALLLAQTGPDDLVVLVSPAAPRSAETLTPLAVRGGEFRSGTLVSGTTRRPGYVTLPDLAPTILDQLGIDQPEAMTGSIATASNSGDTGAARYERFVDRNDATHFRDRTVTTFTITFVIAQILLAVLALVALLSGVERVRRSAAGLGIVIMSIPVVTFLLGVGPLYRLGFVAYLLLVYGGALGLALAAWRIGLAVGGPRRAVLTGAIPVAATYLVLAADITTGGRLQLNTLFGYSPQVAGRFAGFGNPAYSLLAMGTVVLAGAIWALFDGDRPGSRRRWLLLAVVGLFGLTVLLDGHPAFGSDVGGVLSIVPTAFVVVWLLLGRRLRPVVVAVAAGATLLVLGGFAAIDLARPEAQQTHLGRLIRSTFAADGGGNLATVLERKLNSNLTVLTNSIWTLTVPLALLVLVFLAVRPPRILKAQLPDTTANRAILWGGLCLCVLGMAVNDSGVAIPAVMFMVLLPFVLYQTVARRPSVPATVTGAAVDRGADGTAPVEAVPAGRS